MPTKNKQKSNNRLKPGKKQANIGYLLLVALFLTLVWWASGSYYAFNRTPVRYGTSGNPADDHYADLDLTKAYGSFYDGDTLKVVKDYGKVKGIAYKLVSFPVKKDGLVENAMMTLPAKPAPDGGFPVLILCHGYSSPWQYSTKKTYVDDMEFYSGKGFAVIKPDLRGNGSSLAVGSADSAYYSMAYNTDIMSLIASIKRTDYLDQKKISIWGHSMGGYLALRAAVLSPDIKNVILVSAPVGTPADMFSAYVAISDSDNPKAADTRADMLARHGTPLSNPDYWNRTSPFYNLSLTKANIQIHVGTFDNIVPPAFSASLHEKMLSQNRPHEYYVYPRGNHSLGKERGLIWQRSLDLLTRSGN